MSFCVQNFNCGKDGIINSYLENIGVLYATLKGWMNKCFLLMLNRFGPYNRASIEAVIMSGIVNEVADKNRKSLQLFAFEGCIGNCIEMFNKKEKKEEKETKSDKKEKKEKKEKDNKDKKNLTNSSASASEEGMLICIFFSPVLVVPTPFKLIFSNRNHSPHKPRCSYTNFWSFQATICNWSKIWTCISASNSTQARGSEESRGRKEKEGRRGETQTG